MSETTLFPAQQLTTDSIVQIDHKPSEKQAAVTGSNNITEPQKIAAIQSGNDWYQNDLSLMTANLMRSQMNVTMLTPASDSSKANIAGSFGVYDSINDNNHGADAAIKVFNQQQKVYNTAEYGLKSIYQDILGRNPTHDEILSVSGYRLQWSASDLDNAMQAERNRVAYGDETYNRINENVSRIKGYTWNNEADIQQSQDRLANGAAMTDITWSAVYSDDTWNNYREMSREVLGHYADNNIIVQMQAQTYQLDGASWWDLKKV